MCFNFQFFRKHLIENDQFIKIINIHLEIIIMFWFVNKQWIEEINL